MSNKNTKKQASKQSTTKKQSTAAKLPACPQSFGFNDGTLASQFGSMIARSNGVSMPEAQNAPWNKAKRHFYAEVRDLTKRGLIKATEEWPARYVLTAKGKKQSSKQNAAA